jgi:NAD(P)-dependent dehydrogenase (short-subunit alcohol dehydrogenase family)
MRVAAPTVVTDTYNTELPRALVEHEGHAGAPGEIAQMALFLASDAASYVNGQGFAVGGGLSPSLPVVCIVIEGTADTAEAIDAPAYCV